MNRFVLQKSQKKENQWIVFYDEYKIMGIFEHGRFNETQDFSLLENFPKEKTDDLPRIMREIGDWLRENHSDKLF